MPRRNRPVKLSWGPRRTGKAVHIDGARTFEITQAGPTYRTRDALRAQKVAAARRVLTAVTV